MNIVERMIIRIQFIGMLISGSLLFLLLAFAFLAIIRIMIPVSPPEITPPILRINMKPMKSNCVVRIYRNNGIRDVSRKLVFFLVFRSYLNVSLSENDRTK